jgi:hypothetical protein
VSKPENSFIQGVHGYLPPTLYRMKNNNEFVAGIFDCWYSGRGKNSRDLWVEYKFIVLPKRPTTRIVPDLSKLQLHWGHERRADGRNVEVVIGCKEGAVLLHASLWEVGLTTEDFRTELISRKELAATILNFVQPT